MRDSGDTPDAALTALRRLLRDARLAGISRADLGLRVGVSRNTIRRWEFAYDAPGVKPTVEEALVRVRAAIRELGVLHGKDDVGTVLRAMRAHGITDREVSAATGVSRAAISRWRHDPGRTPKPELLAAVRRHVATVIDRRRRAIAALEFGYRVR